MKIFRITSARNKSLNVFCKDACMGTCAMTHYPPKHQIRVAYLKNNNEYCYNLFQAKIIRNENFDPFVFNNECFQIALLNPNNGFDEMPVTLTVDTAAQASVMSINFLQTNFPNLRPDKSEKNIKLIAADNKKITFIGNVKFDVQIKSLVKPVLFYIIKEGNIALFGLPDLVRFQIKLDFSSTNYPDQTEAKVYQIKDESELKICQIASDRISENKLEPTLMKFTVLNKINVEKNRMISISLLGLGENIDRYIYCRAIIFDCDCMHDLDSKQCSTCQNSVPYFSSSMTPEKTINIVFKPDYPCVLEPQKDFFVGIMRPNYDQFCFFMNKKKINLISVEAPGFVNIENELIFEPGYIYEEENPEYQYKSVEHNQQTNESKFMRFIDFDLTNICQVCICKGEKFFCNFKNVDCLSLLHFKVKTKVDENALTKCNFFNCWPQNYMSYTWLVPIFQCNTNTVGIVAQVFPHLKKVIETYICNPPKLEIMQKCKSQLNFAIIGKYSASLELISYITEISIICKKEKISEIIVLNFEELQVSRATFEECFAGWPMKIYLVKLEDLLNKPEFSCKNELKDSKISRVKVSNSEIVSEIKEQKLSVDNLLNILIDCDETVSNIKQLALELEKETNGLKSLWSMSSNEIGRFHEGQPPYRDIVFRYPIKPDSNLQPKGSKSAFLNPTLIPVAIEMIERLLSIGVIERGYTLFAAPTHFIPKPRPELSLQEFIKQGNKPELYVAGLENRQLRPTVRMVHDFFLANSVIYCDPIHQLSPIQQLRQICYGTKYLSQIDVTGCFHSFLIDAQAKQISGFESGISHIGRLRYRVCPMGLNISKCLQDCALLHCFSGINDILLYSDNILVLSKTKKDHLEAIRQVFIRLRNHGLKIKPSKTTLFCTERIKIYGCLIDLQSGKIAPEESKIDALKNRPIPKTKKELKSFLGALIFFTQLAPVAGEEISILHRATRGDVFKLNEESLRAYEKIQKALTNNNLLFSYRPDYSRKFYISVDSSNFHTSWVTFNLCDSGHPRVVYFGLKTWDESYEKLMPAMKELSGVIACLKASQDKLEASKGVLLYTDSLPIILCSVASVTNHKVARFKLFLQSLNWLELSFSPGTSPILSLPDYLSRRSSDDEKLKTHQPNLCDLQKCVLIKEKLCLEKHYKAVDFCFLIDSLLNLEESELTKIKENTVSLKNGKLTFDCQLGDNLKELNESNLHNQLPGYQTNLRNTLKPVTGKFESSGSTDLAKSTDVSILQVLTRGQSSKLVLNSKQLSNKKKLSNGSPVFSRPSCNDGMFSGHKTPDLGNKTPDLGNKNDGDLDLGSFSVYDPNFQRAQNINEYFTAGYQIPECLKNTKDNSGKVYATKLEAFYHSFIDTAQYLDIDQLYAACQFDPYWSNVLSILKTQRTYHVGEKTFFVYKNMLLCKEKHKSIGIYKVVIPTILAHSFVYMSHRHYFCIKSKKLENQISIRFEIRNLSKIIENVVKNCSNCTLTARVPCGRNRQSLPKNPMILRHKFLSWNLDEVQIISPRLSKMGWSKLLCAVCTFSHFLVVQPIIGNLTERMVSDFIQEKIIQYFGIPLFISSDNASVMNSDLVKKVCSYLGIYKTSSAPYQPRSNLQELLNRILLDTMRNVAVGTFASIEDTQTLLSPIVNLINSLTFHNEKILSPYLICFSQLPRIDIMNFYSGSSHIFKSKHAYLKQLILLNSSLNAIRLSQIEARVYEQESSRQENYFKKIKPGAIVSILNPEVRRKVGNFKLCPKYRDQFIVIKRTASAAYLRPCSEINLQSFLQTKHRYEEQMPEPLYKVDLENLKFVTAVTILTSNKNNKFYSDFLQGHKIPANQYFYESQFGAELMNFEDLIKQQDFNENLLEELYQSEISINRCEFVERISCTKKILKPDSRNKDLLEIVTCLKSIQENEKPLRINKISSKKVTFENFIIEYPLIKPNYIYYARKRQVKPLRDEPEIVLRTFRSIMGNHYCGCNRCRVQNTSCNSERCDECF